LEALKHLPHSLADLYDRKLRRVREGRAAEQAMKILQYCGAVKRPLTVTEYREVLSLSLEQKSFDHTKVPNDMDKIINGCCGLTFVDEEEDTIHYVHRSVKECLFVTNGPHTARFDMASVDRKFGFLCMTYLDFTNFKHQLTRVMNGSGIPINPIQFGTTTLPTHTSKRVTGQMARRILSHHRPLQHFSTREVERKAQEILEGGSSSRLVLELRKQGFQFLEYARAYWHSHLTDFTPNMDSNMWLLFCRCIEGDDVPACRPWESEQQTHNKRIDIPEAIQWLLAHGHSALLLYYAMHQSHVLPEHVKDEIFSSANIHNRYRFTEVLVRLENTRNVLNHGLLYAALDGCIRSLSMLIQAGADINAQINHKTALQAAAEAGHLEVVQALLAANADVNSSPAKYGGGTALQAAAEAGHLEVVHALLAANADVNSSPAKYSGRTALQAAAEGGHLEVVHALLAAKADVNASSNELSGTALQAAAEGGHLEVVHALLAAKADVNASSNRLSRTALRAAAEGGHIEVVHALLAAQADANASPNYQTALQAAAEGGHLRIVEALLTAKADVNAPPTKYEGRTALQAAAEGGHLDVVHALLVANADVNASPAEYRGRTALQAAAEGGHLEVVHTLLAAKANIDAESSGRTALQAAQDGKHHKVVQALLAAGAKARSPRPGGDIEGEDLLKLFV
jgi:ankyrin repeat protein